MSDDLGVRTSLRGRTRLFKSPHCKVKSRRPCAIDVLPRIQCSDLSLMRIIKHKQLEKFVHRLAVALRNVGEIFFFLDIFQQKMATKTLTWLKKRKFSADLRLYRYPAGEVSWSGPYRKCTCPVDRVLSGLELDQRVQT